MVSVDRGLLVTSKAMYVLSNGSFYCAQHLVPAHALLVVFIFSCLGLVS